MSVLNYVLLNMRSILITAAGFIMLFLVLYKTSGIKYSLSFSAVAFFLIWMFRCFVLRLYLSDYLGGLHQGERWYLYLFQAANIFNTLLGVFSVALLFKGRLSKNLLVVFILEMGFSIFTYIPMVILDSLLGDNYSTSLLGDFNPVDLFVPVLTALLVFLVFRYGEPILKRYREWNPKHPVLLNICITVYMLIGLLSNYRMAITRGNAGFAITIIMMLIILSYFWYDYLHMLHMQETLRREELVSMGRSIKRHYTDVLDQTAKLNYYRQEIRTAINKIIERVQEEKELGESEISETKYENIRKGKYEATEERKKFLEIADVYLKEICLQYDELTVRKYCEDIQMNEFLLSCEDKLKSKGVESTFLFREYYTPLAIAFKDIATVIDWMVDETIGELSSYSEDNKFLPDQEGDKRQIILHSGMVRKVLVLSCEAEGSHMKKPDPKTIRKLIKRINADIDIVEDNKRIQTLVGIPSES